MKLLHTGDWHLGKRLFGIERLDEAEAALAEVAEIAERERLDGAEIRVLSESGVPRLVLRGAPNPALEQAFRNVLGRYPVSQIRAGRLRAH